MLVGAVGEEPSARRCIPYVVPYTVSMRKTSVYLDEQQVQRLALLSRAEGRPQAEIIREAIQVYESSTAPDRDFELAKARSPRIEDNPRHIWEIPDEELLEGFGEHSIGE